MTDCHKLVPYSCVSNTAKPGCSECYVFITDRKRQKYFYHLFSNAVRYSFPLLGSAALLQSCPCLHCLSALCSIPAMHPVSEQMGHFLHFGFVRNFLKKLPQEICKAFIVNKNIPYDILMEKKMLKEISPMKSSQNSLMTYSLPFLVSFSFQSCLC